MMYRLIFTVKMRAFQLFALNMLLNYHAVSGIGPPGAIGTAAMQIPTIPPPVISRPQTQREPREPLTNKGNGSKMGRAPTARMMDPAGALLNRGSKSPVRNKKTSPVDYANTATVRGSLARNGNFNAAGPGNKSSLFGFKPKSGSLMNDNYTADDLNFGARNAGRSVTASSSSSGGGSTIVDNGVQRIFRRIHLYTFRILELKMREWMNEKSPKLDDIGVYLGYPEPTINVINAAMTQLLGQHRKRTMLIDNFIDMFYYTCDVKHLEHKIPMVKHFFESFLKNPPSGIEDLENLKVDELVRTLRAILDTVPAAEKVHSHLSITIPLMKNLMLVDPRTDGTLSGLKKIIFFRKETLGTKAITYSRMFKGTLVNDNHLQMLRAIIPDMYSYQYVYVNLLWRLTKHLSKYAFDNKKIKEVVKKFSGIPKRFKLMFLERYMELSGFNEPTLITAMNEYVGFFDPISFGFKSEETGRPNIFNMEAHKNINKFEYYQDCVNEMNEGVLDRLILMLGYDNDPKVKSRIQDKLIVAKDLSEEELIRLMLAKTDEALKVFNTFSEYYIPEEKL